MDAFESPASANATDLTSIPVAHERITKAVDRLKRAGWRSTTVPLVVTLTHDWPDGSVDTVVVLEPEIAHSRRDAPGRGMVRHDTGSVEAVVDAVELWPPPGTPSEPLEPIQDQPKDVG